MKYQYKSKKEYSSLNKKIVSDQQKEHETKQNTIYFTVNVDYYDEYKKYYLVIPQLYLDQIETLRKKKQDIFAKGKILTFSYENDKFTFDAVIDSTEDTIYAYLVPIKERYRNSTDLVGQYTVNERTGDLTYYRMKQAIDEFLDNNCCSKIIEKYILGDDTSNFNNKPLNQLFNYNRYYLATIPGFAGLSTYQESQMRKIFFNVMNTIELKSTSDKKIICLIIYAILQMRKNIKDKILICSSSNTVADSISLDLLEMRNFVQKLNILRIYAKNQEIIKRNKKLNGISFHKIIKRKFKRKFKDFNDKKNWIIQKNDIIISTCVNSYNDDIINYQFPFVIIIDANNSSENENLIPLTLNAKHVLLISYEGNENGELNLYERMNHLYPNIHRKI